MLSLLIGNSVCKLSNTPKEVFADLRELLSYRVNSHGSFGGKLSHYPSKRYLLTKRGEFPTGLLYLVEDYLQAAGVVHAVKDARKRPAASPGRFSLTLPISPYADQENAVKALLRANRGTASMPTGTGKSVTMALLVDALQLKTLIIVPNLELKRQLTESFADYFGRTPDITIENIDSPALKNAKNYDALIIDEAHHVAANTYRKLNVKAWTGIYHRFFFTATPFRSKDEEQLLYESIAGPLTYRLTYSDAVKNGYIVPMEAYYYELPKRKAVEGFTWAEVYKELVVQNEERNNLISDLILTLSQGAVPTLCLVKEIAHGNALSEKTGVPFANGMDKNSKDLIRAFNTGEITSLIGTTGVLGEGVDTKPAEFVIVAGLGKSKPAFMQQCGRGFRRHGDKASCKVILFKDRSHKYTLRHFKEQVKILREEYGVEPVVLGWEN